MRRLSDFIKWYFYITTGILFIVAGNFALVKAEMIPGDTLWQILLSGFLTTLVTVALVPREGMSKKITWIHILLHYLGLCVTMVISGYWFGWINLNPAGICLMMVSVAIPNRVRGILSSGCETGRCDQPETAGEVFGGEQITQKLPLLIHQKREFLFIRGGYFPSQPMGRNYSIEINLFSSTFGCSLIFGTEIFRTPLSKDA